MLRAMVGIGRNSISSAAMNPELLGPLGDINQKELIFGDISAQSGNYPADPVNVAEHLLVIQARALQPQ